MQARGASLMQHTLELNHRFCVSCLKKKKTRLLPDLKLSQNVPKHSLFKMCKFYEKINGQNFARGQNVLYNAYILRLQHPL